jgi:hypothetical protein
MPDTAARTLLESLAGQPISTVTGRPNTVLRVEGDSVVVATGRSPTGQPVPAEWVQSGLDQLLETGEIEVSVPSLGHRSSFVGAVLLTLPGAVLIRTTPPRIRLNQPQPVNASSGRLRSSAVVASSPLTCPRHPFTEIRGRSRWSLVPTEPASTAAGPRSSAVRSRASCPSFSRHSAPIRAPLDTSVAEPPASAAAAVTPTWLPAGTGPPIPA